MTIWFFTTTTLTIIFLFSTRLVSSSYLRCQDDANCVSMEGVQGVCFKAECSSCQCPVDYVGEQVSYQPDTGQGVLSCPETMKLQLLDGGKALGENCTDSSECPRYASCIGDSTDDNADSWTQGNCRCLEDLTATSGECSIPTAPVTASDTCHYCRNVYGWNRPDKQAECFWIANIKCTFDQDGRVLNAGCRDGFTDSQLVYFQEIVSKWRQRSSLSNMRYRCVPRAVGDSCSSDSDCSQISGSGAVCSTDSSSSSTSGGDTQPQAHKRSGTCVCRQPDHRPDVDGYICGRPLQINEVCPVVDRLFLANITESQRSIAPVCDGTAGLRCGGDNCWFRQIGLNSTCLCSAFHELSADGTRCRLKTALDSPCTEDIDCFYVSDRFAHCDTAKGRCSVDEKSKTWAKNPVSSLRMVSAFKTNSASQLHGFLRLNSYATFSPVFKSICGDWLGLLFTTVSMTTLLFLSVTVVHVITMRRFLLGGSTKDCIDNRSRTSR